MFPLSNILEALNENEITLDDDSTSNRFSLSSPTVTFSPEFDDIDCVTVDHIDVSYKYFSIVATT